MKTGLTTGGGEEYYSAMLKKWFGNSGRIVSLFLAAVLALYIGLASVHHHYHHDGRGEHHDPAHQCALCFLTYILSSADQPVPAPVILDRRESVFPTAGFVRSFELEKSVYLKHPVIHGPPCS